MYIGFISYNSGEHYSWICKDWKEMYEYCKSDIQVDIPYEAPNNIADINFFTYIENTNSWISISKASEYSLNQIKLFKDDY